MTKICALSDLHGFLPETVPESDILVVAGDISPLDYDRDVDRCAYWIRNDFSDWINNQPAKYRLVIAGNHDFALVNRHKVFGDAIDTTYDVGWTYLQDETVQIEGIKLYGTPWIPNLVSWPFYGTREKLEEVYEAVPDNIDVVISHGPYMGPLGEMKYVDYHMGEGTKQVGASQANDMLERVKPKVFICGHIHEGYGYDFYHHQTHCYNVSINDETYTPVNQPVIIEL